MKVTKCHYRYFLIALFCFQAPLFVVTPVAAKPDKTTAQAALAKTYYVNKQAKQGLPKSVSKLLKKHKIPANNISVYIRDLNSKTALIEHNADKLRTPASTMKLLTTYAGLKKLGPNFSWKTEVWLRGELEEGVLKGDLIIKGFGDPFLVVENFWKLLKTLRDKGLKDIQGDIIIDNSYFQQTVHNPSAFDGKPYRAYNAPSSAVMFNFQATQFLFKPVSGIEEVTGAKKTTVKKAILNKSETRKNKGKPKASIEVIPFPNMGNVKFENQIKRVKGKCRRSHTKPTFYKNKKGTLVIKGNYSAKCKQRFILRTVSKPEQHVFDAFREIWAALKGTLKGSLKAGRLSRNDERFHVYSSPTLGEQIRSINKWSNNVMTKQLLLTLGAQHFDEPGTMAKGKQAVLSILADNGIDIKGIKLENGSGLSRTSKISARQMGDLLDKAYRDAYMPEFLASLPILGVDGTLVNRFHKGDLRGRSHLKTGTIDFVTSIAGYMLNRNGKRMIVVVQHNGKKTGAGRGAKIQDALLRWSFEQ